MKFPKSVMILSDLTSAGVGPLCFIQSKINAAVYQEILEDFIIPSADKLYGDTGFSPRLIIRSLKKLYVVRPCFILKLINFLNMLSVLGYLNVKYIYTVYIVCHIYFLDR